ncbi:hypothetical protein [Nocardioides speluncae]|uniref:hypothetical protein n=1 Tax=Nocardioides speluncae TaxID=2670337 RepID=UPI000D68B4F4|nr:hypothetical protein [Nocardioides speluncae]
MATSSTLLDQLVRERHWQSHSIFAREYDRAAATVDGSLVGTAPGRAHLHRWLAGGIKGLPYPAHCIVLEAMFPGWTASDLFAAPSGHRVGPGRVAARGMGPGSGLAADAPSVDGLRAFVGAEIADGGAALVYPTFVLAAAAQTALVEAGMQQQLYYEKGSTSFGAPHRIDVPVAVAENDVRALLYVSSLLERRLQTSVEMMTDLDAVERCGRSMVSFGLSSNDCTHLYLRQAIQPLFQIRDETDESRFLEYVELADASIYRSTEDTNIGLIVRSRPDPVNVPGRRWFLCAGLGPWGTSGAAWYLANHWQRLHDQVDDRDFVAIVEVGAYSDQTARLLRICHGPAGTEDVQ